jgi:hypothetical protein
MEKLNARARGLTRHAVTLSRRHFGVADAPVRYVIVVVPPGTFSGKVGTGFPSENATTQKASGTTPP